MATEMTKNLSAVSEPRQLMATPQRRVGRLERISNWEQLAEAACFSAAALADRCGVSRRHLERHIRFIYAKSLGGWLLDLRLRQACRLLMQGWSVKETAYSTGFRQVSHFSRCFKNRYKIVPSAVVHSRDLLNAPQQNSNESRQLLLPELATVVVGEPFPSLAPHPRAHGVRSVA